MAGNAELNAKVSSMLRTKSGQKAGAKSSNNGGKYGGNNTTPQEPQNLELPEFDTSKFTAFNQTPLYSTMPAWAYMPAGMKQDNKSDADDKAYAQAASQQAQNTRDWNNYTSKVHMDYINSLVPNYETQQYDFVPTESLTQSYYQKPELLVVDASAAPLNTKSGTRRPVE